MRRCSSACLLFTVMARISIITSPVFCADDVPSTVLIAVTMLCNLRLCEVHFGPLLPCQRVGNAHSIASNHLIRSSGQRVACAGQVASQGKARSTQALMLRRAVPVSRPVGRRLMAHDAHAPPQYEGIEAVVRQYLPHNHQVRRAVPEMQENAFSPTSRCQPVFVDFADRHRDAGPVRRSHWHCCAEV